jgi:uncharacterized protein YeaO (DUF488 family)
MATRGRPRRLSRAWDEETAGSFSSPAFYLHEFAEVGRRGSARGFGIKRIYDAPERADGYRVLIDRLWPRGISKKRASLDAWLTELAPSTALRTWFHRDLKRWPEFARRYRAELRAQSPLLQTRPAPRPQQALTRTEWRCGETQRARSCQPRDRARVLHLRCSESGVEACVPWSDCW